MLSIEHQPQCLWMTNLDFILRRILDKSKFPTHRGIWQDCICFIISSPMFCCFLNLYPHRIGFKQQDVEIRIVLLGHFLSSLTFITFLLVPFLIEARSFLRTRFHHKAINGLNNTKLLLLNFIVLCIMRKKFTLTQCVDFSQMHQQSVRN